MSTVSEQKLLYNGKPLRFHNLSLKEQNQLSE